MTRAEREQFSENIDIVIAREFSKAKDGDGITIDEISRAVADWDPELFAKYCAYHECTREQALLDIEKTAEVRMTGIPPTHLPKDFASLSDEQEWDELKKMMPPDLTVEEQYLWLSNIIEQENARIRIMQNQVDAMRKMEDYLGPVCRSMPPGTTMRDAVREMRRQHPDDFIDDETIVTEDGTVIKLPSNCFKD